jgi:hypothetical protein
MRIISIKHIIEIIDITDIIDIIGLTLSPGVRGPCLGGGKGRGGEASAWAGLARSVGGGEGRGAEAG